ncbi:MAG: hypothetical protein AAGH72_04090 [Verrucomicrobiota bacterium]
MSHRSSVNWVYASILVWGLAGITVSFAQNESGRPSGAYRVVPLFPGEQVMQPEEMVTNQEGSRRAIIIQPDGRVSAQSSGQQSVPLQDSPDSLTSDVSIPGANGMDGIPIDPTRPITLKIEYPTDRQIVSTQEVDIFINLDNYKLGSRDSGGNRLHYILDNEPPQPLYDTVSPITFRNLSQGGHTIRIFAVRPDGRMFRNAGAYAIRHFYVIRKDFQNYTDPEKPYLTVNLPTGEQVATDDQGRIIFDYKLHSVQAGEGFELRYKIGAYEGFLVQDGPVYWSNLSAGKHRIEVELLKDNRQPVIGPFNRIEREFTVKKVMRAQPVIPEAEVIAE